MGKTLREWLPEIEGEWVLPAWLLATIGLAAVGETWVMASGIQAAYHLQIGWVIGGTVASTQAIGAQMLARAKAHNARRQIVTKAVKAETARTLGVEALGETDEQGRVRIEDVTASEPRLDERTPGVIAVLAGVISAGVGLTLYAQGGLTPLAAALATASPAAAVAAALLNGTFAAGEAAVTRWQQRGNDAAMTRQDAAKRSNDAAVTQPNATALQSDAAVTQQALPVNKAAFEAWMGRKNGTATSVTPDEALTWAQGAGLAIADKQNRDKVLRWLRDWRKAAIQY
jgi:hypothetical protein